MTQWHLVLEERCPSRLNMARDTALFRSVTEGKHQGVFRIYNWDEPAVTIGHHQKQFTPSAPGLTIPVVRRPTGGGAVLHFDDFTFSISAPETGPFSRDIVKTCASVSKAFALALRSYGLDVEMKGDNTSFSDICFMRSSPVELCLKGAKILGLALLRKQGFILLQGVIPLRTDRELSGRVFGSTIDPVSTGIMDHAPWFDCNEFTGLLTDAFLSEMDISFSQGGTDDEQEHGRNKGNINLG